MNVFISPNIKKESERIDPAGNIINARTKEIVKPIQTEYVPLQVVEVPPEAPQASTANVNVQNDPLSIQQQIDAAKANLEKLQELKK